MRTALYKSVGPPEQVLEVVNNYPPPKRSANEVLIRVVSTSVNPLDVKFRKDVISKVFRPLPKIPGVDVAGYVEQAPKDSRFQPGDRVFAMLRKLFTSYGGSAEFAVAPEKHVARAPSCGLVEAGSLPLVGCTVLQAVEPILSKYWNNDARGKSALVQAASGGLGTFAVQYCANVLGMEVTAVCSGKKAEYVHSLGARHVVDYTERDFSTCVTGMDLVIDPLRYMNEGKTWSSNVLAPSGHYVSIAASSWEQNKREQDPFRMGLPETRVDRVVGEMMRSSRRNWLAWGKDKPKHHGPVFVHWSGARLERIRQYVDQGKILPCVERVYRLSEVANAHAHVENGRTRGKVVIQVADREAAANQQ